ncbi:hypothetical protein B0H66DRAFT_197737 [Apodospora peruviana]|uniref:Uncharacterized protein n=1 Tax=Apodospora peruviana TaxID=516989 RepID=A0AAE0M7M4_9PEZI|nr:hypothetical protein B0H66DRAFT_197737 [Apodospora peruviana]
MDDAARLVSELHGKLDELNGKVAAYQKDILAEFHRHMDDCLKDYPDHVSSEVSRIIAESLGKYPALNLNSPSPVDASAPQNALSGDRKARDGRKSPPPILYHTSGVPKDGLRSPHEREKEFQGVFTPSYLPLLDGSDRNHNSPPLSPVPAAVPPFVLSMENVQKVDESKEPAQSHPKADARPRPVRRLTDRSESSLESSSSESKVRRSALRRTSSSAKGSPRRVRFQFQDEEVFPSVDPEDSTMPSPLGGGDGTTGAEAEPAADTSAIVLEDEPPAYTGTSLLDVEGEEDLLPRPKKVSSTQALQALSRRALDADGTVWTMVNPDAEEQPKTSSEDVDDTTPRAGTPNKPVSITKPELQVSVRQKGSAAKVTEAGGLWTQAGDSKEKGEDEDSSDDEEFLSIRPKTSSKPTSPVGYSPLASQPLVMNNSASQDIRGNISRTASESSTVRAASKSPATVIPDLSRPDDDDDDPLFDFDAEETTRSRSEKQVPPKKYLAEVDGDDEDDGKVRFPRRPEGVSATVLAKPSAGGEPTPPPEERSIMMPPVSPSAALFGHSMGSYKGTSVMINPITNPQLYDEIANMKDVQSFVGSMKDLESADIRGYRTSLARNQAGTPRSFTERLALEEAMERRGEGTVGGSGDEAED